MMMSLSRKPLTVDIAQAVVTILVECCGANEDAFAAEGFVRKMTSDQPARDWRFQGDLGFGGKFYFPEFEVRCYPEDETPARKNMMRIANVKLSTLKALYEAQ